MMQKKLPICYFVNRGVRNINITKQKRFHVFYSFKFLKYALLLCIVPIVQALIAFNINALISAVIQNIFILTFFFVASFLMWWHTSFKVMQNCICINQGVFIKYKRIYKNNSIAVIDIVRPMHYRIFGAAKVTLYFENHTLPKQITFVLPKKTAQYMAQTIMPITKENSVFAPGGFEKIVLVVLSANIVTTAVLLWVTVQRIQQLLGTDLFNIANAARENLALIQNLLNYFLPAGLAFIASIIFGAASLTILHAFFKTGGLRVCRFGGIILSECGILSKTQRRIKVKSITSCDVRVTPTGRLLNRNAVYVTAGSFKKADFPVMIISNRQAYAPQILMADYFVQNDNISDTKQKSLIQYLYKPVFFLIVCTLFLTPRLINIPAIMPLATGAILFCVMWLVQCIEGYYKEGVCTNNNRTLSLNFTRFLTLHKVCIFINEGAYSMYKTPFSIKKKRVNFTVRLPSGIKYKARGVNIYKALKIKFTQ